MRSEVDTALPASVRTGGRFYHRRNEQCFEPFVSVGVSTGHDQKFRRLEAFFVKGEYVDYQQTAAKANFHPGFGQAGDEIPLAADKCRC